MGLKAIASPWGKIYIALLFEEIYMVGVAQLVERQIVALVVVGSTPIAHPAVEGPFV